MAAGDRDREMGSTTPPRVRPDNDGRPIANPVVYSAAVSGSASTLPRGGTSRLPRPARLAVIAGAAVVALWVPSLIATAYAEVPAADYVANPAKGWAFLWESVTASRNPRLGTADAALQEATQVWAGAPAVASDVALKAIPSPWEIPVPAGATAPAAGRDVVTPQDELQWVVTGSVADGPEQVIGLLDYRTGRVAWDIRPLAGAGAR
jgi:hypothetical protein